MTMLTYLARDDDALAYDDDDDALAYDDDALDDLKKIRR
jgi:hypothetical protein